MDYLKIAAQNFGKEHNLTSIVCDVYDSYDGHVKISREPSRHRRIQRRSKQYVPDRYSLAQYRSFTLSWPIDRSQFWLSSKFGPRKKKNDKAWGFHYGIDLAALKGTAVHAAAKGIVVETSSTQKGYGNSVVIEHNERFKTRYAHLERMIVCKGQRVTNGQLIGYVGDTGSVHGKNAWHLHFEVIEHGKRINPLRNLS